jgi:hypothetical protein
MLDLSLPMPSLLVSLGALFVRHLAPKADQVSDPGSHQVYGAEHLFSLKLWQPTIQHLPSTSTGSQQSLCVSYSQVSASSSLLPL